MNTPLPEQGRPDTAGGSVPEVYANRPLKPAHRRLAQQIAAALLRPGISAADVLLVWLAADVAYREQLRVGLAVVDLLRADPHAPS